MKREGRQHGLVRTYPLSSSDFDRRRSQPPPTAGLFTKVSPKPTNHSKFTGKCGKPRCSGCHLHPVCKSKLKSKGTQKLRSIMQMEEPTSSSDNYGLPATVILDHLATYYSSYTSDYDVTDDPDVLEHAEDDDEDWCLV